MIYVFHAMLFPFRPRNSFSPYTLRIDVWTESLRGEGSSKAAAGLHIMVDDLGMRLWSHIQAQAWALSRLAHSCKDSRRQILERSDSGPCSTFYDTMANPGEGRTTANPGEGRTTANPGEGRTPAGHASPRRDEGLNPSQFQQLLTAVLGAVQAATTGQAAPTPGTPTPPTPTTTKSINWSQMPKLDLARPGELDFWFISLEGRLRAAQVPEPHWAEKVMECPGVDESIKMRIRQLPSMEYGLIRQSILKEHGPIDPMGFFLRAIHRVKGTYREEIREQLTRLLTVYNRAAADDERSGLTQRDLCYPFLDAFPATVGRQLEQQLALVFVQDDPFEHLFRLSPARPAEPAALNYTAPASDFSPYDMGPQRTIPTGPKRRAAEPSVAAALMALTERMDRMDSRAPKQRRMTGDCRGCGGHCANRANDCPAYGRTCFGCNRVGHFANVCDAKPAQPHAFGPRRGGPPDQDRSGRFGGARAPNHSFRSGANLTRPA